ncbi:MAG: hypothetical protein LUH11_03165 [Candidatus Gastranaerophilales bacterium]|nr:hypothetical protein [Candidatus Gastranaerophilales bacterium]
MSNLLNAYISNQSANRPLNKEPETAYIIDNQKHTKPMEYKGKLLPSKIFGSPVEYAKDLKKDIISIGQGAKGKANDHQLGRINDLAMKIGSLALASYLFVKNPLKLSKAMEFAGFGTFFASMALWPKLAIQAPLKARTGVDIHQKYVDSQDRKKMLYQDPQYDLTDLYSREDLDKMGKKLKVSDNLPDRDSFIKQRAKKTAVQGNTMWMMTAGFASPIMSALACNILEKPLGNVIEKADMITSEKALDKAPGVLSKIKEKISLKSFDKFLSQNSDKVMDDKMISDLASRIGKQANSADLQSSIAKELSSLKNTVNIDEAFIKKALNGKIQDIESLTSEQKALLDKAVEDKSLSKIAGILSKAAGKTPREQNKLAKEFSKTLESAKKKMEQPEVSQVKDKIKTLNANISSFASKKTVVDKYINSRVKDQSGSYIANQWNKVCSKLIKSLKFSDKELKAASEGNLDVIVEKLEALASSDAKFDKTVKQLMKLVNDYEDKTVESFITKVKSRSEKVCSEAASSLKSSGFTKVADKISAEAKKGTVENVINVNTKERIEGAKSSFYRLLQSLDLSKQIKKGNLEKQLKSALENSGQSADKDTIIKLTQACKDLVMNATTTDYVEKLKSSGFNLSDAEYKTVMQVMFGDSMGDEINRIMSSDKAMEGFNKYKKSFMDKIANWKNGMTPELSRRIVGEGTESANAVERAALSGKPINSMIQDAAKQAYNSRKWLKMFGGAMIILTGVTLIAGLAIGRKGKTEKEVEAENKVND